MRGLEAHQRLAEIALRHKPHAVCVVPEKREELTTEGGLDVVGNQAWIAQCCQRLAQAGIDVSLFIDADPAQIRAARECGAPTIEIHTGHYADAADPASEQQELAKIRDGVAYALEQGLVVNAGHGLHYHNTLPIAAIPGINELNIGHSIIARAVISGLDEAVRSMRELIDGVGVG